MSCTAFFFDLNDGALREMPPIGNHQETAQLPECLALKVHNRAIPTRDELDATLAKANKNREKILNKKVAKAKQVDVRVAKAKQLKREMDENMTLLGNTVPHNQRAIPSSPTLPQRLQQRLQTLEAKSPPMTADMIRERESRAETNRARILQQRCEKASSLGGQPFSTTPNNNQNENSNIMDETTFFSPNMATAPMTTPKKLGKEPPIAPFSPTTPIALPKHLVDRLEAMPSPRTTKQLLDRCSNASRTREGLLRLKAEKARKYLDRVELTRIKQVNSMPSPELPGRLVSRLEKVTQVHSPEQLLAKEARAAVQREELLAVRVEAAKQHAAHSAHVAHVAMERQAQQAQVEQIWSSRPEYTIPTLPANLQAKLDTYLAKRPSPTAILDHHSAVALRHDGKLSETVSKAKKHAEMVELRRMNRGNIAKPAKLTNHLTALLATRSVARGPTEIIARCDKVAATREAMIKERVSKLIEARMRREGVRNHAKAVALEKLNQAADTTMQLAKVNKTASFVPAKLRAKLVEASKKRPTPTSILNHEGNVVANHVAYIRAKARRAHDHNEKVANSAQQVAEMKRCNKDVVNYLPPKLQKRMQELATHRPSPVATIERERKAMERRGLLLAAIKQREVDRNSKRMGAAQAAKSMHEQLHKPAGSPLLPNKLRARLDACVHATPFDLMEKESKATLTRDMQLKSIQDKAKAHAEKVELRRMCKHNNRATTVSPASQKTIEAVEMPERLARRLAELDVKKEAVVEKVHSRMESAVRNRNVAMAARVGGLHMHNSLVQQRHDSKKQVEENEITKPTTTA